MSKRSLLSALAGGSEGWAVAHFGGVAEAEATLALASPLRRQIFCAFWAQLALRAERVDAPDDLLKWQWRLRSASKRSLLGLAGFGSALGMQRALGHLGWMALDRPESYLEMADLLERDGDVAKALRHLDCIDSQTISLLAALPSYACSSNDIARLRSSGRVTPNHLHRQRWRVDRLRSVDTAEAAILQRNFVTSVLAEASGEYLTGMPFPAAPWSGSDELLPIDSVSKLECVARRFFNCLGSRMSQVRQGASYYYELRDVAMIEIERVSSIGWEVADAAGPRNASLSAQQIHQLKSALARAPTFISPILPDHLTG